MIRFICKLYTNQSTRVEWNGIYSAMFHVMNGVKQGGVASPVMFCIYIDELLTKLSDLGDGCWFGKFYVGVIAYADDVAILAPSAQAMRNLLSVCDSFAAEYDVVFNSSKSKSMICLPKGSRRRYFCRPNFFVNGQPLEYVEQYTHLGHVISSNLDDKFDINRCRSVLIRQINNVLCFFRKVNPIVKMRLLLSYCYSLYGSVLWNLVKSDIERVCTAWRAGIRRVWGLPPNTHRNLLPSIACCPPLADVIVKRFISFVQRCLSCDCEIVRFVTKYGIWFGRMASPIGCSTQFSCEKFAFHLDDVLAVSPSCCSRRHFMCLDLHAVSLTHVLLELLFVRHGMFDLNVDRDIVDCLIGFICTA